jgi:hypothetical protein
MNEGNDGPLSWVDAASAAKRVLRPTGRIHAEGVAPNASPDRLGALSVSNGRADGRFQIQSPIRRAQGPERACGEPVEPVEGLVGGPQVDQDAVRRRAATLHATASLRLRHDSSQQIASNARFLGWHIRARCMSP